MVARTKYPTSRPSLRVPHLPEPIISSEADVDPEQATLLADAVVGLALLVVLETLDPAERLAFVLHDMFDVPFGDIAPIVGRSPAATRQFASRARRRVKGADPLPDSDLNRQWEVVNAFLAASRGGDFDALLAVLDPEVVVREDAGVGAFSVVRGAQAAAGEALTLAWLVPFARPALVNGAAGAVVAPDGRPQSVVGFTVKGGKIVAIDILTDPERLRQLDLAFLDD